MIKEILYTSALDEGGNIITINNAEKGQSYYCPECKSEFIYRNSGKKGKGSRRPHFAHNNVTTNCTPEGILHFSFKKLSLDLLDRYLSENKRFEINWNCTTCFKNHQGNLLENVTSIKEEYNLKVCQPDIALLDVEGKVIAVIEIVVTHSPEEKVIQYYKENKIILIQINLASDEDIKNVERKISNPDIVEFCENPNCSTSINHSISRKILSYHDRCGRCFRPIERYCIEISSVFGGKRRILDFTDDEIKLVESNRNNIKIKFNKSTNEKFPISICQNCKRLSIGRRSRRF